jgi:hypothetical protein
MEGLICKKVDLTHICTYASHQTLSWLSMDGHTRSTKHMKISQGSLYEVSLYEVRKAFSDDTCYQTHPNFFRALLCGFRALDGLPMHMPNGK